MKHVAVKSLLLENGIAMLIEAIPNDVYDLLSNFIDDDVSLTITDYGFDICIKGTIYPIQENMIDHLAKNPLLVVFSGTPEDYLLTPVYNIKIPPELVLEARGAIIYRRTIGNVNS